MDKSYILVRGGKKLCGKLQVQGSKNTVLPVLAASLLAKGKSTFCHCPRIDDVFMMLSIMDSIGCPSSWDGHTLTVDTGQVNGMDLPVSYTGNFRASVLLMGALLGRCKYVSMGKPGGCQIGKRPIDFHLAGFQKFGVKITEEGGRYICSADRLLGTEVDLPFPSVGATENLMLAAVACEGDTVLTGCAREPEIQDLAKYLVSMGAAVSGAGTDRIVVKGGRALHPADYNVPADRIAAATYLVGTMAAGGKIKLIAKDLGGRFDSIVNVLGRMGADISADEDGISLLMEGKPRPVFLATGPHPNPPTDIQSMVLAAALCASGPSVIEENIFESRYDVAGELNRMGGRIEVKGRCAYVCPCAHLLGQEVYARDLRGGAALVIAGLFAKGQTKIRSIQYLKRGYEDITKDFRQLGADIVESVQVK